MNQGIPILVTNRFNFIKIVFILMNTVPFITVKEKGTVVTSVLKYKSINFGNNYILFRFLFLCQLAHLSKKNINPFGLC